MAPASIVSGLFLLTSASKVTEDSAKIAVRFGKLLLRFLAIASGCTHDDCDLQVGSRFLDQLFRLVGFDPENLLEHVLAARAQLMIPHPDVDHPVAVGHTQ